MNNVVFSDHARKEMLRRNITQLQIEEVLQSPEQIISVNEERNIYQSRFELNQKQYLLRVVGDIRGDLLTVVTIYKTSKVKKYWSEQ
ncbi:DUF4258 domain-containing protein [Pseudanabaena sp. FACHB-1277]|jgi:hypothetical protein|uniref:DUF4258 domain-containing protein n=1 Tax=Pseudanabaena cinerea FACHB-1277 TaxID=2949581 RepID=A0A926UTK7_9CYAN|nr:DUF4258 domain-containing protein [Pseudanabaena cinerea]MBD2150433.1 DUF4258 domain-containing protein [Pseudanabaena cinerea FACHB-1277]